MKMKVARIKGKVEKEKKGNIQEGYSLKSLIKILLIISILFCLFYFLTMLLAKPNTKEEQIQSVIDNSKITMNQLLNRSEDEYYVLAFKESLYKKSNYVSADYVKIYNSYINEYTKAEDSLNFYYIDLDDAFNKKYFGKKLNITNDMAEIVLNDEILFKIEDGKIEKTYVGKEQIIDKLSRIKK